LSHDLLVDAPEVVPVEELLEVEDEVLAVEDPEPFPSLFEAEAFKGGEGVLPLSADPFGITDGVEML